jgi:hypothetical protein
MNVKSLRRALWFRLTKTNLPDWTQPQDVDDYLEDYGNGLSIVLEMVDTEFQVGRLRELVPIFSGPSLGVDLLEQKSGTTNRDDLVSLVRTQRATRSEGAWAGFCSIAAIQPGLSRRILQRVHRIAVRTAPVAPGGSDGVLMIGPASVQALVLLNNMMCLHRSLEALPSNLSRHLRLLVQGPIRVKQTIAKEIEAGLKALARLRGNYTPGDLVFFDSLTPIARRLGTLKGLGSYLDSLMVLSPLSLVKNLNDETAWEHAGQKHLAGVELLLDHRCPFQFTGPVVQGWVDLLMNSQRDAKTRSFDRIERIIDYLTSERGTPYTMAIPAIQTGRYCFQTFVRVLCRSWPDEAHQQALFEADSAEAVAWYDVLSRVQRHIDRVEKKGLAASPFVPQTERRNLEYAMVLAQRHMAGSAATG